MKSVYFTCFDSSLTVKKLVMHNVPSFLSYNYAVLVRKLLYNSLFGFAPIYIIFDNLKHEYSFINGVKEDTLEITLNIKNVNFKLINCDSLLFNFVFYGPFVVYSSSFVVFGLCEVYNPRVVIFTILSSVKVSLVLFVSSGTGYNCVFDSGFSSNVIRLKNCIYISSNFNPFRVIKYRVFSFSDYDRISFTLVTKIPILSNFILRTLRRFLCNDFFCNNYVFVNSDFVCKCLWDLLLFIDLKYVFERCKIVKWFYCNGLVLLCDIIYVFDGGYKFKYLFNSRIIGVVVNFINLFIHCET